MEHAGLLDRTLATFTAARAAIEETFGVESAGRIVAAVARGAMPREGNCRNGWEYYVHGIGYTVVMPSGGQVHLDGSGAGDHFSVYDIAFYLNTSNAAATPSVADLEKACDVLVRDGRLRRVGDAKYSFA